MALCLCSWLVRFLHQHLHQYRAAVGQILGFGVFQLVVADAPLAGHEYHTRRGHQGQIAGIVGYITALLTAIYMARLYFRTFEGKYLGAGTRASRIRI